VGLGKDEGLFFLNDASPVVVLILGVGVGLDDWLQDFDSVSELDVLALENAGFILGLVFGLGQLIDGVTEFSVRLEKVSDHRDRFD